MSLVKALVEMHGERMTVENQMGKGSTFKVELPSKVIEETTDKEEQRIINSKVEILNIEFSNI